MKVKTTKIFICSLKRRVVSINLNSNLTVRYNPETDCLDVIIDGNIVPTNIKCYAQSTNWFLNGVVDEDFLGLPIFKNSTNSITNPNTYKTDGYLLMSYSYKDTAETAILSTKRVPVNMYKSITIKFLQTSYNTDSAAYKFCVGLSDTNNKSSYWITDMYNRVEYDTSANVQTVEYSLTSYNQNGVERFLLFFGITKTKIYEITFNK